MKHRQAPPNPPSFLAHLSSPATPAPTRKCLPYNNLRLQSVTPRPQDLPKCRLFVITNGQSVPKTSSSCSREHNPCPEYTIRGKERSVLRQGDPFQASNGLSDPKIARSIPGQPTRDHESCSSATNRLFLSENCRARAPPPTGAEFETALPKNGKTVRGKCISTQLKRPEWRLNQKMKF